MYWVGNIKTTKSRGVIIKRLVLFILKNTFFYGLSQKDNFGDVLDVIRVEVFLILLWK